MSKIYICQYNEHDINIMIVSYHMNLYPKSLSHYNIIIWSCKSPPHNNSYDCNIVRELNIVNLVHVYAKLKSCLKKQIYDISNIVLMFIKIDDD